MGLVKQNQEQVNGEGDGSIVHVSVLNNSPFPCHTQQRVVEREGHARSPSEAASGVSRTGGQSFTLGSVISTPAADDGSNF